MPETFLKSLKDHWFVVAVLFSGGMTWGVTQYRVSANASEQKQAHQVTDSKIVGHDNRISKIEDAIAAIAAAQAAAQATAAAQQQSLDRIDRNLEEIARELRTQ